MKIGYFTESPYQDPELMGKMLDPYAMSNDLFDPSLGADLWNRYLDEKIYVEEMGFDMFFLNEHHSAPFCMRGVINVEAAILARVTKRAKIVLQGNILPLWDDPLWLAEQLATIDVISRGRLVTGWVRGGGMESIVHDAQTPYNWERFQEAHELILKAWTTPGPFRWEGEHFTYRYVNPWPRPYQKPHPPLFAQCAHSKGPVEWAAQKRYPATFVGLVGLDFAKRSYEYYDEVAREQGYEAGPQHRGYMMRMHVEDTDEKAYEVGAKILEGVANPFGGALAKVPPAWLNPPGYSARGKQMPLAGLLEQFRAKEREFQGGTRTPERPDADAKRDEGEAVVSARAELGSFDQGLKEYSTVVGTPKTVLPKLRHILETLRPGHLFIWDGDGSMTHDDAMRSIRLMGEEVLPAIREIGKELELNDSWEVDPATGANLAATADAVPAGATSGGGA